jgi:hypothetical protein
VGVTDVRLPAAQWHRLKETRAVAACYQSDDRNRISHHCVERAGRCSAELSDVPFPTAVINAARLGGRLFGASVGKQLRSIETLKQLHL